MLVLYLYQILKILQFGDLDVYKRQEDSFADWEDSSDTAPEDERLEETLAEERTLELESERCV